MFLILSRIQNFNFFKKKLAVPLVAKNTLEVVVNLVPTHGNNIVSAPPLL